jgi:hypothetical protein
LSIPQAEVVEEVGHLGAAVPHFHLFVDVVLEDCIHGDMRAAGAAGAVACNFRREHNVDAGEGG